MTDRNALKAPSLPLLRRLHRWWGQPNNAARRSSIGLDSTRMDLGYEAAYAPPESDRSAPTSRFDEERPTT